MWKTIAAWFTNLIKSLRKKGEANAEPKKPSTSSADQAKAADPQGEKETTSGTWAIGLGITGVLALIGLGLYSVWAFVLMPIWTWSGWTSTNSAADLWSTAPGFGIFARYILFFSAPALAVIGLWWYVAGKWEKRKEDKKADPKTSTPGEEKKQKTPTASKWDYWPVYLVPKGFTAWVYAWAGNTGNYLYARTSDGGFFGWGLYFKWFGLNRVVFKDNRSIDLKFSTKFLPAGEDYDVQTSTAPVIGSVDRRGKKIESGTGAEVTGKLSFPFNVKAGVAEGELGAGPLTISEDAFSDIRSPEVLQRFEDWVSDRVYQTIRVMPFRAAYHLDWGTLFIGEIVDSAGLHVGDQPGTKPVVGFERYRALYERTDFDYIVTDPNGKVLISPDGEPYNIFKIDLSDQELVFAVIRKRPHSLLAKFVNAGYWIYNVALSDVNSTKPIEDAQESRVVAVYQRGTELIRIKSRTVDLADGEAGARQIHAEQTVASDSLYVENTMVLAYELHERGVLSGTVEEIYDQIDARKFSLEQLRRLVQVVTDANNPTLLLSGGDSFKGLESLAAGVQVGTKLGLLSDGGKNPTPAGDSSKK